VSIPPTMRVGKAVETIRQKFLFLKEIYWEQIQYGQKDIL